MTEDCEVCLKFERDIALFKKFHDSFATERTRQKYVAHRAKVHGLAPKKGLAEFE